jgi:myo-inositol-1(or 4)-monophosphatase
MILRSYYSTVCRVPATRRQHLGTQGASRSLGDQQESWIDPGVHVVTKRRECGRLGPMNTRANDPVHDVDFVWLERIVRAAGDIALRHFQRTTAMRKQDNTLVTVADREIETYLRGELGRAFPNDTLLGEEYTSHDGDSGRVWAIDPIDGTAAYAAGLPVWGVSIGILQAGQSVAGVFYVPVLDEYYSGNGRQALLNHQPIHVDDSGHVDGETLLCVTSEAHRHYRIDFSGKTRAFGSAAAHICYVARGTATAAVLGHLALWDMAGALPVLRAAGGDLVYLPDGDSSPDLAALTDGRKSPRPLMAGAPWALRYFAPRVALQYKLRKTDARAHVCVPSGKESGQDVPAA